MEGSDFDQCNQLLGQIKILAAVWAPYAAVDQESVTSRMTMRQTVLWAINLVAVSPGHWPQPTLARSQLVLVYRES